MSLFLVLLKTNILVLTGYTTEDLEWLAAYGGVAGFAVGAVLGLMVVVWRRCHTQDAQQQRTSADRTREIVAEVARRNAADAAEARYLHSVRQAQRGSQVGSLLRNTTYQEPAASSTPRVRPGSSSAPWINWVERVDGARSLADPLNSGQLLEEEMRRGSRVSGRTLPAGSAGNHFINS